MHRCAYIRYLYLSRTGEEQIIESAEVVLFEGILVLYSPDIRSMLEMKLFVDLDSDTRLARRGTNSVSFIWHSHCDDYSCSSPSGCARERS